MLREWNRLFPESWRNTWRKNVLVSSLTVSPNVVKYLNVPVFVDVFFFFYSGWCFVILSRQRKWRSEEHQAVSSVSPARQRQENCRKSERIVSAEHGSSSATDSALPLRRKTFFFQLLVWNMHVNSNGLHFIYRYGGEFQTFTLLFLSSALVCAGADEVHSAPSVCYFEPQAEDPDWFGQKEVGLFWGEMWISLAKDQVRRSPLPPTGLCYTHLLLLLVLKNRDGRTSAGDIHTWDDICS